MRTQIRSVKLLYGSALLLICCLLNCNEVFAKTKATQRNDDDCWGMSWEHDFEHDAVALEGSPDSIRYLRIAMPSSEPSPELFNHKVQLFLNHIDRFRNLRRIYIWGVTLDSLPLSMTRLPVLCCLSLNEVTFKRVPQALTSIPALQSLYLENQNLDVDLSQMRTLDFIYLSNVHGKYSKSFYDNTHIKTVILEDTGITSVSDEICSMNWLSKLELIGSYAELPKQMGQLKELKYLLIYRSEIKELPESIYKIPRLHLTIAGCGHGNFTVSRLVGIMNRKPKGWEFNVIEY